MQQLLLNNILSTSYRYKGFALIKIPSGGKPPEPPIPRFTRNQRGGGLIVSKQTMEFDKTAYYTRDVVHSVKLFYRLVKIFHHLVKIFHRLVKSILPASLKHSLRSCFKLKPVKYFSLFGKIFSLHGKIFSLHGKIISPLYLHPLYSKQLLFFILSNGRFLHANCCVVPRSKSDLPYRHPNVWFSEVFFQPYFS